MRFADALGGGHHVGTVVLDARDTHWNVAVIHLLAEEVLTEKRGIIFDRPRQRWWRPIDLRDGTDRVWRGWRRCAHILQ